MKILQGIAIVAFSTVQPAALLLRLAVP